MFIDQPEKIIQMRQNRVLLEEQVPADLARTFRNLEQNGNPWGLSAHKRMDWTEGRNIPTIHNNPNAEYLLWIGCAGSLDDRIKNQTLALVDILEHAEVSYAILGAEETCTGDPARRAGNEMLYQMLAQENIENLNAHSVKKVITACPHCLHTIGKEYPQLGGNYKVYHHTQIINELTASGKVNIQKNDDGTKVAFHDPCYLGRWNGEYEAPRNTLAALTQTTMELPRHKENSFCCGAGGGRMWMEEKTEARVNHNRIDEAVDAGADVVATGCPFCSIMLEDGAADRGVADQLQVLNLAELVARQLPNQAQKRPNAKAP